jgi:hypothetical protein
MQTLCEWGSRGFPYTTPRDFFIFLYCCVYDGDTGEGFFPLGIFSLTKLPDKDARDYIDTKISLGIYIPWYLAQVPTERTSTTRSVVTQSLHPGQSYPTGRPVRVCSTVSALFSLPSSII